MTSTTTYTITNRTSGLCLGAYSASTELDAVQAMAIDAGYASLHGMAVALETTVDALLADLRVMAVSSQSLEADVADAMIALDCAEIDRLETSDVVAAQAADGTLDCEWSDRDIATMLRDAGTADDDAAIAKVRRVYVRRMAREFAAVAS